MTTSCNVTVAGTPAYGRCQYKYFVFLLLWKVCPPIFAGPAGKRLFFLRITP